MRARIVLPACASSPVARACPGSRRTPAVSHGQQPGGHGQLGGVAGDFGRQGEIGVLQRLRGEKLERADDLAVETGEGHFGGLPGGIR